jgi:hypothetical protein
MNMNDEELIEVMKPLVAEGMNANEVRSSLMENHGIDKSYKDIRLLMVDCVVLPEKEKTPKVDNKVTSEEPPVGASKHLTPIQGHMVSGDVSFSSGHKGFWYVNTEGSLKLDMSDDYENNVEDLGVLAVELEKIFK